MKNKLLEKTFQILEAVASADQALSLKELSGRFRISPATLSRIVADLQAARLVEKRNYHSVGGGLGLIQLGNRALENMPLTRIVNPVLRQKSTQLGVQAAMAGISNGELVYLFRTQAFYKTVQTGLPYRCPLGNSNIAVVIATKTFGEKGAEEFFKHYQSTHPEEPFDMDALTRSIRQVATMDYSLKEEENHLSNICFPLRYADRIYGISFFEVKNDSNRSRIQFEMALMMNSLREKIAASIQ